MWFSGLAIGLPELLVGILSIFVGIPGLAVVWWMALTKRGSSKCTAPPSLYLLTAAVLLDFSGLVVLWNLPAEASAGTVVGVGTSTFVMSSSLLLGFVFLILSMIISTNDNGPVDAAASLLSKMLLGIALLGIVCIVGCLPQAPWNRS
jgi:hypothetical protein